MRPIRAVLFDLFDTLVDLRHEDLPLQEHEGRCVPPTTGELHAALGQRADVGFDAPEQCLKDHTGPSPDITIRDLAEIPALLSRGEVCA